MKPELRFALLLIATLCLALWNKGCSSSNEAGGAGITAVENQAREGITLECMCQYEAYGYGSVAECVDGELGEVVNDCEREAYRRNPGPFQASLSCILAESEKVLTCLRAAGCDEAAVEACDGAGDVSSCPEPSPAALDAYDRYVAECSSGAPSGCPDVTGASGLGEIASGNTNGTGNDFAPDCGGDDAPDVAVEWTAPAAGTYTFDTSDSDFDTVLAVYTACDGAELACNDDASGLQSEVTVTLEAGQTVIVVVTGFSSDFGPYVLRVSDAGSPAP